MRGQVRDRHPARFQVRLLLPFLPIVISLSGCAASIHLTPLLSDRVRSDCILHGHVSYDGNREYLPAALLDDAGSPSDLILRYVHEEKYGLHEMPVGVQLVNPLNFVGFPTGSSSLSIAGRLDVIRGGAVVRSFAAVAAMERNGSMFGEGETFTAMRRRGLLLIKDNISAQVCADLRATQALLDHSTSAHESQQPTSTR
jgi:hypothetical protein